MQSKQNKYQRQLVTAYNHAMKQYTELQKQGYNFTKTTERVMGFERLQNKLTGTIKKSDIDYYKKLSKKTELYKRAKSYTDIDSNKTMSVKQGRLNQRRKNIAEKKRQQKELTGYQVATDMVNSMNDVYKLIDRKSKQAMEISAVEDKNRLLSIIEGRKNNARPFSESELSELSNLESDMMYMLYGDQYYTVLNKIEGVLNGTGRVIDSDFGEMSMIGTPYEDED